MSREATNIKSYIHIYKSSKQFLSNPVEKEHTYCYRLKVCIPSKCVCLRPRLQFDGTRRWTGRELALRVGDEDGSLMMGLVAL